MSALGKWSGILAASLNRRGEIWSTVLVTLAVNGSHSVIPRLWTAASEAEMRIAVPSPPKTGPHVLTSFLRGGEQPESRALKDVVKSLVSRANHNRLC